MSTLTIVLLVYLASVALSYVLVREVAKIRVFDVELSMLFYCVIPALNTLFALMCVVTWLECLDNERNNKVDKKIFMMKDKN